MGADGTLHGTEPASAWVARWIGLVSPGSEVLDLACGRGRHARLAASRGHRVLALDRDADALATLAGVPGVTTLQADVEAGPWPFVAGRFGGIIVTNYLHRPLFAPLIASLAPGGVLVYETFARGNERFGSPRNPAFLLEPGELLAVSTHGLCVLGFEQGLVSRPKSAQVQRLCAVRETAPDRALD